VTVSAGLPQGPAVPDWDPPASVIDRLESLEALDYTPMDYLAFADPIQEAMDAAGDAGGGRVVVPPATWTRSTTLTWNANVTMAGVGDGSLIHYTGSGHAVQFGSGALDVDTPWVRLRMRDVKITGTVSATSAIRVRGVTRWRIEDVTVDGFTAGAGILLNGASFIGKIDGGRITNCDRGISARKVGADGAAGEGQAFNAIEVCGQLEIQDCTTGVELGDPINTETTPVVGMGANIHDITVESCDMGVWVVSANRVGIHDSYFEGNSVFDIRVGSTSGNTHTPVACEIGGNFIYTALLAIDLKRALAPIVQPNYILSDALLTVGGIAIAATVTDAEVHPQKCVNIDTEYTDGGTNTVRMTHETSGLRVHCSLFAATGDGIFRPSDFGQVTIGRVGPGNEAGINAGQSSDTALYRAGAGYLRPTKGFSFIASAAADAPNNSIFLDSADNVLKQKNNAGTVSAL
jgi:hypothetical protein